MMNSKVWSPNTRASSIVEVTGDCANARCRVLHPHSPSRMATRADRTFAQPQKPLRALAPQNENAPLHILPGKPSLVAKTIHQRNKSTPALSTLMSAGGLKATAAKRAPFADTSNTVRPQVKDDMQMVGKAKENIVLKDASFVSTKDFAKPSVLNNRPAQRPLANITNKANASTASDPLKPASLKTDAPKALLKKATTVFREQHSDPLTESTAANVPARQPLKQAVEPTQTTSQRVAKPLPNEPTSALLPSVKPVQRKPLEPTEPLTRIKEESVTDVHIEGKYTNGAVEVKAEQREHVHVLEEQARALEQQRHEELANSLARVEQEEYWDEDEEDEFYDADGYTTARSLRSRGDNTTGGVTLVLAPRITAKSKRELEAAAQWVEAHRSQDDVEDELWDTSMVAEYGEEIYEYMHALEDKMRPNATYMDHQAEIQWSMRAVLMDWLVQVHNRFTLLPETLFLAVNYVDRFLSAKVVSLGKLQLVGATALFLAAKYEEINCPSVQEIVYMVDGAYTIDEVLKAERFMLSMLQFELGWPGPMSFLRRISKADDYDLETRTLSKYFLEVTIMDERFVGCAPSFLAAGAHCLARLMLKKGDWVCQFLTPPPIFLRVVTLLTRYSR
jgi:G2/mitotic-specific cyclin 3/4